MSKPVAVFALDSFEVEEEPTMEMRVAKRLMGVYQKNPQVDVFVNGTLQLEGDDYEIHGRDLCFFFSVDKGAVITVTQCKKDGTRPKQVLKI